MLDQDYLASCIVMSYICMNFNHIRFSSLGAVRLQNYAKLVLKDTMYIQFSLIISLLKC